MQSDSDDHGDYDDDELESYFSEESYYSEVELDESYHDSYRSESASFQIQPREEQKPDGYNGRASYLSSPKVGRNEDSSANASIQSEESYYSEVELDESYHDSYRSESDSFQIQPGEEQKPDGYNGRASYVSSPIVGRNEDSSANASIQSDYPSRTSDLQPPNATPLSKKDRAAAYRREFEELIDRAENGEQLTTDEDDRLYFLELYARSLVGEVLEQEEAEDLEGWLREEDEAMNQQDNRNKNDVHNNSQERNFAEGTQVQSPDNNNDQCDEPGMVPPPDHGSLPPKLWELPTHHDASSSALDYLQQPEMIESSDNGSSSSDSQQQDPEIESGGVTGNRVPLHQKVVPTNDGDASSMPQSPEFESPGFDIPFGENAFANSDQAKIRKKKADWGAGFGSDPFEDGFGNFHGLENDSEQDDVIGKMQDRFSTDLEPKTKPVGSGLGGEDGCFGAVFTDGDNGDDGFDQFGEFPTFGDDWGTEGNQGDMKWMKGNLSAEQLDVQDGNDFIGKASQPNIDHRTNVKPQDQDHALNVPQSPAHAHVSIPREQVIHSNSPISLVHVNHLISQEQAIHSRSSHSQAHEDVDDGNNSFKPQKVSNRSEKFQPIEDSLQSSSESASSCGQVPDLKRQDQIEGSWCQPLATFSKEDNNTVDTFDHVQSRSGEHGRSKNGLESTMPSGSLDDNCDDSTCDGTNTTWIDGVAHQEQHTSLIAQSPHISKDQGRGTSGGKDAPCSISKADNDSWSELEEPESVEREMITRGGGEDSKLNESEEVDSYHTDTTDNDFHSNRSPHIQSMSKGLEQSIGDGSSSSDSQYIDDEEGDMAEANYPKNNSAIIAEAYVSTTSPIGNDRVSGNASGSSKGESGIERNVTKDQGGRARIHGGGDDTKASNDQGMVSATSTQDGDHAAKNFSIVPNESEEDDGFEQFDPFPEAWGQDGGTEKFTLVDQGEEPDSSIGFPNDGFDAFGDFPSQWDAQNNFVDIGADQVIGGQQFDSSKPPNARALDHFDDHMFVEKTTNIVNDQELGNKDVSSKGNSSQRDWITNKEDAAPPPEGNQQMEDMNSHVGGRSLRSNASSLQEQVSIQWSCEPTDESEDKRKDGDLSGRLSNSTSLDSAAMLSRESQASSVSKSDKNLRSELSSPENARIFEHSIQSGSQQLSKGSLNHSVSRSTDLSAASTLQSISKDNLGETESKRGSINGQVIEASLNLADVFLKPAKFFAENDKQDQNITDTDEKDQKDLNEKNLNPNDSPISVESKYQVIAPDENEPRNKPKNEPKSPSASKRKNAIEGKRTPTWRKKKTVRKIDKHNSSSAKERGDLRRKKPKKIRTQKEIEERKKKRKKRKLVKRDAKGPALLAFVSSVNTTMFELEKIEREMNDENLKGTSPYQLLDGFDALMGIFLQLSDEIELISTFTGLKKKKKKDYDSGSPHQALKEVLAFAESLDQLFADLKPIVIDCLKEDTDEVMEIMLFRLNALVDLLCETSHRVGEKQEWNDRAETTYVTLLELMELATLELQCYFEDVDVPEQGISANIHEAWSATGHLEELQALQSAANDPQLFRQICYEVIVSTDQWCPDVDKLMETCDIDPEILDEEPDPEYLEEKELAPIPRAAEQILDKINGDPLPRSEALAAILRRMLPPRAMTDLTLLNNFTSIRNTLDNPLGLSATNLVAITSAPEVLNDPKALGVAGVGKSTLAAMVTEHPDVRRYFIDGVVWIHVGNKELTYSRYTRCLRDLVDQLDFYDGVPLFAELIHTPGECLTKRRRREEGFMIYARDTIVELLEDRSVLIILDDICFEPDLDWFDFAPMPEGSQDDQGTDVTLLVSTRVRNLLPSADTVEVDMLDEADAIRLLIQESGQLSHTLMAESKEARSVVRECAYHPLAVKSVGRWLGLKHVTAGVVSSVEEIHSEVVKSMEKILKGGEHSGTDMMYEILSLSLSPAINGEATNIIKYCFAAFVIVFCDKEHVSEFAMTESTPVIPMSITELLFETLLEINESSLLQEGSLFYAQKKEAAVLIPEALSALGVLKVGTYSDVDDDDEEHEDEQKFLQIMHSIHHEYGEYLCFEEPALKMLTKDAEQEWNRALVEAFLKEVEQWDENLDDGGHSYALEMIVSHTIRGAMYSEAADLLANKSFVRGRLMSLGRESATRRHIKDCSLLSTKLTETRSKISKLEPRSVMKRAYQALGSQLTMKYDAELVEDPQIKDIEIARAHYEIGFALAENRCWDAAIVHWEMSQNLLESALGTVEVVAGIMFNIGFVYSELNEYEQALDAIKQCLRIRGAIHGEQHILYAQTIQKIGDIFLGMSDYSEAIESYNWATDVMNREPLLHRVAIGEILDNRGSIHRSKGELEESLKCHQEALMSKQLDLGEGHPELVITHQHIGNCLAELGNDDDAIIHLTEAIRLKELDLDGGPEGNSDILTLEGFIHYLERNQEQGLECYEKALQILVTKAPHRKEKVASLLHLIGCVYLKSGHHKKAMKLFEESLQARRKVLGFIHPEVASTLFNMAFLYETRNCLDKALKCLEEALKIRELRLPETETVAATHVKIGSLSRKIGKMKKGQIEFEKALRIRTLIHSKEHISVGSVLHELGDLMNEIGEYDTALSHYVDALDIQRKDLGIDGIVVAKTLYSMGSTLQNNDEPDRALVCFDESLSIQKYHLGEDSKEVGDTLNLIGFLKAKRGDSEEALLMLWEALKIRKKQEDNINASETLYNIGNVHREKQDHKVAIQCYEECLRIRRAELGDEHEKVADSLIALGNVYGDMKKNEEAMQAYQDALKIRTMKFGKQDERVATVLQYMGTMEFRSGNQDQARGLFTEFIRIRRENNTMNDGDFVNVLFTIGNIHKLQGNKEAAQECWIEAYQVFEELGLEETLPQIASMMNDLLRMEARDDDKSDKGRNAVLSFFGKIAKRPKEPIEPKESIGGKKRRNGKGIQL